LLKGTFISATVNHHRPQALHVLKSKSNHGRNEVDESMRGRLRSTAWRSPEPTTGSNAQPPPRGPQSTPTAASNADDAAAAARAGPPSQWCLGADGREGWPREAEVRRGRRSEARVCAKGRASSSPLVPEWPRSLMVRSSATARWDGKSGGEFQAPPPHTHTHT
jgi:hypothetical protein